MNVPLLDLKAQFKPIKDEVMKAVEAVFESQQFINGPQVKELEKQIAAYTTCKSAIGVSSGTDALLCALMAFNIGNGDEVITTPFTFFATAGCIWRTGAKPVFVDIDPKTYNIDVTKIEKAITKKTKAIIPVHLFGQMADMDPIMEIAKKQNLFVIEDACQSIGSTYKGKQAGSIGTVGCFSFFPSKNLGTAGDGGIITAQDPVLGEKLEIMRGHGSKPKYFHQVVGGNFRLDTIHAAILIVKLKYLNSWSEGRRKNAAKYNELLKDVKQVVIPFIEKHNVSIFNQYVIRIPKRDELRKFLTEKGIGTEIYYPLSLHEQACFKALGHKKGDFPESEKAAAETAALPIYPELSSDQIKYVADCVKEFYNK
ncbi:MAG TPA: transcriptional regulator [Lentisphaeria bacterium]|nr:MAG: transcriptional regulator [Lentisphaerae bacterium GWF2_49_21]HBC87115.1 transcriptional regulator [Lentisphaeria bacterium]